MTLGSQLQESTVLRIIVIVYSLFFFLPTLSFEQSDSGPYLATQLLQTYNSDTSISLLLKNQMVADFISGMQRQYGKDALISLIVIPLNATPIINRLDLYSSVRAAEMLTVQYSSVDSAGLVYSTTALFNHHPFYVQQAGLL